MFNIAILSEDLKVMFQVRSILNERVEFNAKTYKSTSALIEAYKKGKVDAFVFVVNDLEECDIKKIKSIRSAIKDAPLVVVSSKIEKPLLNRYFENTIFLNYPTELLELGGIVKKMLNNRQVRNRKFKRHSVTQFASIMANDVRAQAARILNLSKGGVQLRSFYSEYNEGDFIQIKVETGLGKNVKFYHLSGKVVWSRDEFIGEVKGTPSQRLGIKLYPSLRLLDSNAN